MKHVLLAIGAVLAVAAPNAHAKRDYQAWPIADVMQNPDYMAQLSGVAFSWGDTIVGDPIATTNVERATEGLTKSDKEACEWALLSALKLMRVHALERGAKSVQGLKSTVSGQPYSSETEFLCLSGFTHSRVFLTGSIVADPPPNGATSSQESDATMPPPQPRAPITIGNPERRSKPAIDPDQQRYFDQLGSQD